MKHIKKFNEYIKNFLKPKNNDDMKKFTELNEKKQEPLYKYGVTMMYFDIPNWKKDILSIIDKDDVYDKEGYGYENEPHITLLYGFLPSITEDDVKDKLLGIPKPVIVLKNISIFQGTEYDVVKFDIENNLLHELNSTLNELPNENEYPVYHPHMTICYVKAGRGSKYIQKIDDVIVIKPNKIIYSIPTKNGMKNKKIDLKIW
ncbi:MAG: 2'-5' RNA ligase family protein [Saccharofermentanales bacterium]